MVFVATVVVMARVMQTRVAKVMPWRRYGTLLAVAGAAYLAAAAVGGYLPGPTLRFLAKLSVFGLCYCMGASVLSLYRRLPPVPEDSEEFSRCVVRSPDPPQ